MVSLVAFHSVTTLFSFSFYGQFSFPDLTFYMTATRFSLFFPSASKSFVTINKTVFLYYTGKNQTAMNRRHFQLNLSDDHCASHISCYCKPGERAFSSCSTRVPHNRKVTFYAKSWRAVLLHAASAGEKESAKVPDEPHPLNLTCYLSRQQHLCVL